MLIIKIYCLEDREESNIITVMKEGEHSIGRGDTLNCNDKRVSRNHAMIIVTKTKVTFKSTHINPSFYKAANGKNIQLLKNNDSIFLNDGDQFALLADKFWFKVKIEHVENDPIASKQNCDTDIGSLNRLKNTSCDETTTNTSLNDSANITPEDFGYPDRNCDGNKTINESSDLTTTSRENNVETKVSSTTCTSNFFNSKDDFGQNQSEKLPIPINECDLIEDNSKEETLSKAENDISDASNESLDLAAAIDTKIDHVSKSDVENEEEPKANSSVKDTNLQTNNNDLEPKTKRDRCWYGNSCYRKNLNHRVQFSHPGDDDYDSDPADDKPKCPYGVTCYRRNADHRKQFKHSHQPKQQKTATTKNDTESDEGDGTSNKQIQKKRKKTTKTNTESDEDDGTSDNNSDSNKDGEIQMSRKKVKNYQESSEDDYDMEDPFINDNSSDDYQPTSDDSDDSNWEDSQQVEEESEETKRLIKEAKKFTKVKKRK